MPRAIKFVSAQVEAESDTECRAVVRVDRAGVGLFTGAASGGSGELEQLRAVARATADALSTAYEEQGARVRLRGVQVVEFMAQPVVIVSLAVSKEGQNRSLVGVCQAEDPRQAAALAVLSATNRFLQSE